jgi:hypothetical protein
MRTTRIAEWTGAAVPLPGLEDLDLDWIEREPAVGRVREARAPLAGFVTIVHLGREYAARYELSGERLSVYCGLARNTACMPAGAPSPKPLAERLLRELIDAEHPGLTPD